MEFTSSSTNRKQSTTIINMTFQDIYNNEKEKAGGSKPTAFLNRIAVASICSVDAVYQWATGWRSPSRAAAELVSRELGIPAAELFPKSERIKRTAGAVVLVFGIILAIGTADGSSYELGMRFAGIGMTAAGGFIGKFFKQ